MNVILRVRTYGDRLKFRLVDDEIADLELDLVHCPHDAPGYPYLMRTLFAAMDTRKATAARLTAAGVPVSKHAMDNPELLAGGLLSVMGVLLVLIVVMGLAS